MAMYIQRKRERAKERERDTERERAREGERGRLASDRGEGHRPRCPRRQELGVPQEGAATFPERVLQSRTTTRLTLVNKNRSRITYEYRTITVRVPYDYRTSTVRLHVNSDE